MTLFGETLAALNKEVVMRGQFNKSNTKGRDSSALVMLQANQDIQSASASGEEGNDYWDEHGEFCEEIIVPEESYLGTN